MINNGDRREASNSTTSSLGLGFEEEWDGSTIHSGDNNTNTINDGIGHIVANDENEGNGNHHIIRSNSFNNDGHHHQAPGNKLRSSLRRRTKRYHSSSSSSLFSVSSSSQLSTNSSFNLRLQQQLHLPTMLHRKPKREVLIAEARHRAALRVQPPPFASDSLVRLHELKEAKQNMRLLSTVGEQQQQQSRSWSSDQCNDWCDDGDSSVNDKVNLSCRHERKSNLPSAAASSSKYLSSTNNYSISHSNSWKAGEGGRDGFPIGNRPTTATTSSKLTSLAGRHCLIFLVTTLLHMAILSLAALQQQQAPPPPPSSSSSRTIPQQYNMLLSLLLIALQSISLRYLLTSCIIYSFDNIDFGQLLLVRNMSYVKRMFVTKVQTYSNGIAMGLAGMSIGISWLLSLGSSVVVVGRGKFGFDGGVPGGEGGGETNCSIDQWYIRAHEFSTFLTSRLGVFVLAALILGRIFLPQPKMTKDDIIMRKRMQVVEEEEGGDKEGEEAVQQQQQHQHQQQQQQHQHQHQQHQQGKLRRGPHHSHNGRGNNKAGGGALSWSATFILAAITAAVVSANSSSSASSSSAITPHVNNETALV